MFLSRPLCKVTGVSFQTCVTQDKSFYLLGLFPLFWKWSLRSTHKVLSKHMNSTTVSSPEASFPPTSLRNVFSNGKGLFSGETFCVTSLILTKLHPLHVQFKNASLIYWYYIFFLFLINLFIFNWRVTALQNCVDFCQTSAWISHRYTHIPSLLKPPPTSLSIHPQNTEFPKDVEFLDCYNVPKHHPQLDGGCNGTSVWWQRWSVSTEGVQVL